MSGSVIPAISPQQIVQQITDQIVKIADEILTEKIDALFYEGIMPSVKENVATIFASAPVQLEAAKMFNREIFPIYERQLQTHKTVYQAINDETSAIRTAMETYAKSVSEKPENKEQAKTVLMEEINKLMMPPTMGGGNNNLVEEFTNFNKENEFKIEESNKSIQTYVPENTSGGGNLGELLQNVLTNAKKEYAELNSKIEEAKMAEEQRKTDRIGGLRIPGFTKDNTTQNEINELKKTNEELKQKISNGGGESSGFLSNLFAKTQEPVAKTQEPVAKTQEPVAKTQEPVAKTQEPVAKTQEPAAKNNLMDGFLSTLSGKLGGGGKKRNITKRRKNRGRKQSYRYRK